MSLHPVPSGLRPGDQIDFVEVTSNAATSSSVDIVSGNAISYDGATRIKIEYYTAGLDNGGSNIGAEVHLYEGATDLGIMGHAYASASQIVPASTGHRFLTPSAGVHTYKLKLVRTVTAGTVTFYGGAGGTGVVVPGYLRITKA